MNIYRPLVLILYTLFLSTGLRAELPKYLSKELLKTCNTYKNHVIVYNKTFKYPQNRDTIFEKYSSQVAFDESGDFFGWHYLSWARINQAKGLAVANDSVFLRVNFPQSIYFSSSKLTNRTFVLEQFNSYLYLPLTFKEADWEKFKKISEDKNNIIIETSDSIWNGKKFKFFEQKTVWIRKSDYFPIKLSIESVNGSNKQLAVYEIESIRSIPEKNISLIRHSADSVFLTFKKYTNGDSIKNARLSKYRDFKIGDTLRLFDGLTVNDDTVSIKDHLDSILIIDFFYTTCKPCLAAIPEINRVWEAYNGNGVSFFGLNGLVNDWKSIPQFISLYQPKYNILKIPQQVIFDFGVKQYPRLFVLKNGILIKVFYGFKPGTDKELIELIEKLKMN